MTETLVSDSLKSRRQALHSQRRLKVLRGLWQFSVLSTMVGTLTWVTRWPEWMIHHPSQVSLAGNHLVSDAQLLKLVPHRLPQFIWQISTRQIDEALSASPAIAHVQVSRQLLPAQLSIWIEERQPVAVAVSPQGPGYLDQDGVFIPAKLYTQKSSTAKLPNDLIFWGYDPQYRDFWQKNYPLIKVSPVTIRAINGTNANNLTLTTDLGIVHLGSDLSQFSQQLTALGQLKALPKQVPVARLNYIDLTNPAQPTIQLKSLPAKLTKSQNIKKP